MKKFLKRSTWTDIIISLVFIFLGVLLIAKPNEMMSVISILLGSSIYNNGVLKLVEYFTSEPKEDYLLTMALIGIIIGVIVFFVQILFQTYLVFFLEFG